MREIKFRAWDEDAEIMYYSDDKTPPNQSECCFVFEDGNPCCYVYDLVQPSDLYEAPYTEGEKLNNIMQFTGLKDKNGKEIYDNDILDAYPPDGKFLRTMKWNSKLAGYQLPFSDGSGTQLLTRQMCLKYEVIGNIHENPKFLQGKEGTGVCTLCQGGGITSHEGYGNDVEYFCGECNGTGKCQVGVDKYKDIR